MIFYQKISISKINSQIHLDILPFVIFAKVLLRIEFEQPLIFSALLHQRYESLSRLAIRVDGWDLFFLSKRSIKEHFSVAHKKLAAKSHTWMWGQQWNKIKCASSQNVGLSSCRQVNIQDWNELISFSFFLICYFFVVANCILEISSVDHFQFLSQYTWSLETAELQDHPTLDMKQVHLRHFMLQLPLKPNRLTLKTMKMTKKVTDQHKRKSTKLFEESEVKCSYFALNVFWNFVPKIVILEWCTCSCEYEWKSWLLNSAAVQSFEEQDSIRKFCLQSRISSQARKKMPAKLTKGITKLVDHINDSNIYVKVLMIIFWLLKCHPYFSFSRIWHFVSDVISKD